MQHKRNGITTRSLVLTAVLSATAFLLMFIDFSIPALIPSFIKMDISDLPALLGSFLLGPIYGIVISALKNLLILVIKGTSTAFVGELSNFLLGTIFSVSAGLLHRRWKKIRGAAFSAVAGAFFMAVASVPLNYFLTYPAYEVAYGMPMETIISLYQSILPAADTLLKCLVIFNLPFTLCKGLLDAALCIALYRPMAALLHRRTTI